MPEVTFGRSKLCVVCGGPFEPSYESQSKCFVCGVFKGKEPKTMNYSQNRPAQQRAPQQRAPQQQPQQRARRGGGFWNSPQAQVEITFAPFLTKNEKRQLAQSGDVFHIKAVRYQPGANYGPQWAIDIEYLGLFNEAGGNDFTFTLQSNTMRDAFMQGLADYMRNHRGEKVPALLVIEHPEDGGSPYYAIVQPGQGEAEDSGEGIGFDPSEDVPF